MAGQSVATLVSSARSGQLDVASLVPTIATYLRIAHQVPGRIRFNPIPAYIQAPPRRAQRDQPLGNKGLVPGDRAFGHGDATIIDASVLRQQHVVGKAGTCVVIDGTACGYSRGAC